MLEEGEEGQGGGRRGTGGGRGEEKGRDGERGKCCTREARAAPEGRRETRGREGEVRGREGERPTPLSTPSYIHLKWKLSPTSYCNVVELKQNKSTEGCSKLKISVDMTSSGKNGLNIRTNASPKWDRTSCPEE